jgi:hypothetical protein
MMAFRVGQKVINVKGSDGDAKIRDAAASRPVRGEIVTIKTMNYWPHREKTLLTFVEHDNSHLIGVHDLSGFEPGFDAECFRPVVERKTDISIFEAMLTGTKKRRVVVLGEG